MIHTSKKVIDDYSGNDGASSGGCGPGAPELSNGGTTQNNNLQVNPAVSIYTTSGLIDNRKVVINKGLSENSSENN